MINEFTSKKLGAVLAYSLMSNETFDRGRDALETVLGAEKVLGIAEKSSLHTETIRQIGEEYSIETVMDLGTDETASLLHEIRDKYLKDEWDDSSTLLEWIGFLAGGSIAHWASIQGVGDILSNETLIELAKDADTHYRELLDTVKEELESVGQSRGVE